MRFLRDQGLAITMFGIFAVTMVGLVLTGWNNYNGEQIEHSMPTITLAQYLTTPSFGEAVFENWESEFLQMGAYVLLTAFLFSRGSSESKDPDSDAAPQDADPRRANTRKQVPWPVRAGGITLVLYEHSLTLALFGIFAASFVLHAVTGAGEYSEELLAHGGRVSRRSNTSARRASGSSRSRTGRANSWPSGR